MTAARPTAMAARFLEVVAPVSLVPLPWATARACPSRHLVCRPAANLIPVGAACVRLLRRLLPLGDLIEIGQQC